MSSMKFKLTLPAKRSAHTISYTDSLFLIGSCFSENIGAKLSSHLFKVVENPHGILFNPVSVARSLADCIENKKYTAADLFLFNEVWNSWQHHTRYSGITQQEALDKIGRAHV